MKKMYQKRNRILEDHEVERLLMVYAIQEKVEETIKNKKKIFFQWFSLAVALIGLFFTVGLNYWVNHEIEKFETQTIEATQAYLIANIEDKIDSLLTQEQIDKTVTKLVNLELDKKLPPIVQAKIGTLTEEKLGDDIVDSIIKQVTSEAKDEIISSVYIDLNSFEKQINRDIMKLHDKQKLVDSMFVKYKQKLEGYEDFFKYELYRINNILVDSNVVKIKKETNRIEGWVYYNQNIKNSGHFTPAYFKSIRNEFKQYPAINDELVCDVAYVHIRDSYHPDFVKSKIIKTIYKSAHVIVKDIKFVDDFFENRECWLYVEYIDEEKL